MRVVDTEGEYGRIMALAAVDTILAASGGGLMAVIVSYVTQRRLSLLALNNGVIAGMVSVCAGANTFQPWAALVVGLVAGLVYTAWSRLLIRFRIDDPLDAVPVHFGAGWWGVMAQPLFSNGDGILFDIGNSVAWHRLGWNMAGALVITVWTSALSFIMFLLLHLNGFLRIDEVTELSGTLRFCRA
jgi:Amt family ammonium transporter